MEVAYRKRDSYLPKINEAVVISGNLVKALNQKNPKRLHHLNCQAFGVVIPDPAIKLKPHGIMPVTG